MRHKFPVLTVKKLLKSVSIYGSYRKNKTGTVFLEHSVYLMIVSDECFEISNVIKIHQGLKKLNQRCGEY